MKYTTPPGIDEREIAYPNIYTEEQVEEMKRYGIKFINWNEYAMATGPIFTTKFLDDIMARLNNNRSAIILVTGPPGEGKTYFAIRIGQMYDKKFDIIKQLCFTRLKLLKILSGEIRIRRGQVIILDEAHIATGARSWGKQDQQDLINLLATARSKGYLILIIALHQSMLDVLIRKFMGSYMIGMEKPGLGTPYRLFTPRFKSDVWKHKYDPLEMALPDAELCDAPDCLDCDFMGKCMTIRAVYERMKRVYLDGLAKTVGSRIEAELRTVGRPPRQELIKIIHDDHRDKLRYNNRGRIDYISVIDIAERLGWAIGSSQAQSIAKSLYENYKDLRPQ